jgi:hypothetical protein
MTMNAKKAKEIATLAICPVAKIAAEQARLILALNDCKRETVNGWEVDQMLSDKMDANADLAATLPAQSIPGALFQLALLTSEIDDLLNCVEVTEDRNEDIRANAIVRSTIRLIFSIRCVLEKAGGIEGESAAVEFYCSDAFDPFRQVYAALVGQDGAS